MLFEEDKLWICIEDRRSKKHQKIDEVGGFDDDDDMVYAPNFEHHEIIESLLKEKEKIRFKRKKEIFWNFVSYSDFDL